MSKKLLTGGVVGLVAVAVVAFMAFSAGTVQAAVDIGEEMPDFTMTSTAGEEYTLSDHRGKVVALIFTSQHCPWVNQGSNKQAQELEAEFEGKDVKILHIDSHADTSLEDIAAYLDENEYSFTVLKDVNNEYADKVNAQRTPEVFVLCKDGTLRYHGAFDNRTSPPNAGEVSYIKDAINATLNGEDIENPTVRAWGCTIKRVS
jgi:peroxiredoxin